MRITIWRGAIAAGVIASGVGGVLAAPSGASPQYLGPVRDWHGMKIRSMDPVPAQFQHARAASEHPAARSAARSATTRPATGTTTTTTTTTTTPPPTKPTTEILSNETTFTRWAYTDGIAWIHKQPSSSSHRIVRTNWYTEDGFPETYVLLRQTKETNGDVWVKIRIPGRPNGRVGWVPRDALGNYHLTHQLIVVNRKATRLYLYQAGRRVWSAPVGVGKGSTPTPAGHFWIRERFKITDRSSGYYPYAFGTSDYSTLSDWPEGGVVGIHGPYYDPQGIPGHISHGCIRLEVRADAWLAHHVSVGTPVHVV